MTFLKKLALPLLIVSALSGCAYKINVLQGNFLEQSKVEQLRVEMSYEQVLYVLGRPVIQDTFEQDIWYYVYEVRYGTGEMTRKELILTFENGKLVDMKGDYEKSEEFDQALAI